MAVPRGYSYTQGMDLLTDPGLRLLAFVPVVMAANALSAVWLYGLWKVTRSERAGRDYALGDLACLIVPPLVGVAGLLLP
jgi:hypothetical protein